MSNYVNITASVGKNGINKIEDVYPVQILLNKFIIPGCLKPTGILQQDGDVGNKTIAAIKDFQRRIVGFSNPDGRVDPGGKTIKALNGPLKWASAATHSAESTKEWALGLGAIKSGLIEFDLVNRASATMKKLVVRNTGITSLTISKNLHDPHGLEIDHHLEATGIKEISDQYTRGIAPNRMNRLLAAP